MELANLSRRHLLRSTLVATPMLLLGHTFLSDSEIYAALPTLIKKPKDPNKMTDFEKAHVPQLGIPPIAEDGSIVPAYVEWDHPMDADHYIKNVEILLYEDPIVNKGKFHFTPQNGLPYISTQVRIGESGRVVAISECNKHGKWIGYANVKVTVGGC